jgi:hypothetical protein
MDTPEALRYPISFEVRGEKPLMVAFADDDGTWTKVTPSDAGTYMIEATSRHAIAMVCGSDVVRYRTEVTLRTRFDDAPFLFCFNGLDLPAQPFAVTGTMMQPGQVSMEATDTGTTSPWTFDLTVSGGMHDLIAYGESMVLMRRNVAVTAAATLPAIDLAQGGAAYVTTPVLLDNVLPDETVETVASVFTGNDLSDYVRSGSTLYELPPSFITTNDFQFAEIRAKTATTERSASIEGGAAAPMITLMPRLTGIEFTDRGATWSDLPDSTAEIRIFSYAVGNYASVEATGSYIAGATEIEVTLDIPDFDPAWRVTDVVSQTFIAYDDEFASTSFSSATSARRAQAEQASRHRLDRVLRARSAGEAVARARR